MCLLWTKRTAGTAPWRWRREFRRSNHRVRIVVVKDPTIRVLWIHLQGMETMEGRERAQRTIKMLRERRSSWILVPPIVFVVSCIHILASPSSHTTLTAVEAFSAMPHLSGNRLLHSNNGYSDFFFDASLSRNKKQLPRFSHKARRESRWYLSSSTRNNANDGEPFSAISRDSQTQTSSQQQQQQQQPAAARNSPENTTPESSSPLPDKPGRQRKQNRGVGGYDPSERLERQRETVNVGDPQIKVEEKEFSVTSILRELAAIQQKGPQKYCILGTRHCSYLHQQIIELL